MNDASANSDGGGLKTLAASLLVTASAYWWIWAIAGLVWLIIAVVILQFDRSSATTIGVIAGIVFLGGAIQSFAVGRQVEGASWIWYVFGALMLFGSAASLLYPGKTFVIMSMIIGTVFVVTGFLWGAKAFAMRAEDAAWWIWAAAGMIVFILGVWLGGQFVTVKAVTLTAFTALWAAVKGARDIAKALQLKRYRDQRAADLR